MIKVYATVASVGFLVAITGAGCSSANTPDEGSGGTTSTPTAGTSPGTAGTTVIPNGGTGTGTAGTASTPTAGTATGTAGTPAATAGTGSGGTGAGTAGTGAGTGGANAACKGIKSNMACTPEGTECLNLACGLADSGVRSCKCATNWTCAMCDFTNSPFATKPADITTCTNQADKLDCTGMMGKVCEGAAGGEVCACAPDDEGSLIWDCDKPPSTWAAAAAQ
jgi:hypothetical protein